MLDRGPMLVVAAHADDEALGAAGTIAAARRLGSDVHILILSTSATSRELDPDETRRVRIARRRDAEAVAARLSASVSFEDFPDNAFDTVPARHLVSAIERRLQTVKPAIVLTHWPGDLSLDHRATAEAVYAACRPVRAESPRMLLSFEIRSSTEWLPGPVGRLFQPTAYVPLDDEAWSVKCDVLNLYQSELRPSPHPRSIETLDALARLRGSEVGFPRAEAFCLTRLVLAA